MGKRQETPSRGTAVVVLGMHRSGTSILTRVLNVHGCALSSRLLGANPSNPSGHWESSMAIDIDERLLADLGRSWDDLRELPRDWMRRSAAREAKDRIKILIESDFRDEPLWAIKDPRMCRLAPLWIEAITELGFQVKVVIAVRHPREVALSLLRRDGLRIAHGLMLWTQHVLEAEVATRQLPRVVVSHRTVSSDWRQAVERIRKGLALEWTVCGEMVEQLLEGFISDDRIHINEAVVGIDEKDELLPDVCRKLYRYALAIESGEQQWPRFIAVSDRIRSVSRLYSPVVDELHRTIHTAARHKLEEESRLQQLSDFMLQTQDRQNSLMTRLDRVGEFETQVGQLREELAKRTSERDLAIHEFEIFRKWASRLEGEVESLREALGVQEARAKLGDEAIKEFAKFREWASLLEGELKSVRESLEIQTARAKVNDETISNLRRELRTETYRAKELDKVIEESARNAEALDQELQLISERAHNLDRQWQKAAELATGLDGELQVAIRRADNLQDELRIVNGSLSMRLTRPLRVAKAIVVGLVRRSRSALTASAHLISQPGRYFRLAWRKPRQIFPLARGFMARGGPKPVAPELVQFDLRSSTGSVVVLTTRHCEYIAREIHDALERVGIASEVIFEQPAGGYADAPHFVICPQMFPVLPGFYVAFQMEQSVSSRWFTEDYIDRLEKSYAIFDYSTRNISFLKEKGVSLKQVYYLPIGHLRGLPAGLPPARDAADYDVVFYGDTNNERRQAYLRELRKCCRVRVVSEVFGEELYGILSGAKLVVNIHYYAGALLETTRVWECLSLGKLVVSERSTDMEDHGELEGLVDFVEIDDVPGMVSRVRYWLQHESEREQRVRANEAALAGHFNRFDYFFYRFLLATDNISFDEFWRQAGHCYRLKSDRLCLNLPEYTDRSQNFARDNHYGFTLFPGLRHGKGWLGCAMSYKYMIMLAREQGLDRVTICEDDVEFPVDFGNACASIEDYLSGAGVRWDIFSGLMADLHRDAKILAVDQHDGRTFVTTDRLISTVMNIYDRDVFDTIAKWDESNRDVETNTIDRYLERNLELRVIVTDPFLVGHKEDQHSTIWGFQNTQYADLIVASSQLLKEKISRYQRRGVARGSG